MARHAIDAGLAGGGPGARPSWPGIPRRVLAAALVLAVAGAVALPVVRPRAGELPVYVTAAARLVDGAEIYRPADDKPFTYPPFFALPFVPLLGVPAPLRAPLWYLASFAVLGGAVALVLRRVWPALTTVPPPRAVFLGILAALVGRHLISPLEYQGHDLLLLGMLVLGIDAWAVGAPRRAGVWLGLAAASKATPLLFLPVLVWQGALGGAAVMAATTAGATLLPDLILPRAAGGLWVRAWYGAFVAPVEVGGPAAVEGAWRAWNHLNQSLSGTLYRLLTPVPHPTSDVFDVSLVDPGAAGLRAAVVLAQTAVLGLLAWATWPRHGRALAGTEAALHRLGQGGAVLGAMLLLSPMSSKPHFAVLVVPLAYALADFLYRRRSPVVGVLLGVVALGTLTTKDAIGRPLGNLVLAYGSLTWCALAALLATACVLVARPRAHRLDGPPGPRDADPVTAGPRGPTVGAGH